MSKIQRSDDWIRTISFWWSDNNAKVAEGFGYADADIGLCRLEPFDTSKFSCYPNFKRPGPGLKPGTSLCKIGFPFHNAVSTYDEATAGFHLAPGTLPMPVFPLDGIFTRVMQFPPSADGYPVTLLETSSPGLKGQSGGPIVDRDGTVWAIQVQTRHLPLGFSPKAREGRRDVTEHQFMNVGCGVHPETLEALFARHSIAVNWVT